MIMSKKDISLELLNRIFAQWPDMLRYLHTAQLTTETQYIGDETRQRECITVTLFNKRTEAHERHDEREGQHA